MASKCFPYRPHDYVYDPIFTVSGPVDHYKAAVAAKMSTAKFQICPVFPNMFSDLPNHPRVQLVQRRSRPIPRYIDTKNRTRQHHQDPALLRAVNVAGADRAKFFCHVINLPSGDALPFMRFPTFTIEKYEKPKGNNKARNPSPRPSRGNPPYVVVGQGDPEILKLDFLKYGSGLPAGMHEMQLIERARMKAAWETNMKIDPKDEASLVRFREYMEAIELDEWAFREKEIQEIQNLRLELLENMLNEVHKKSKDRIEAKMRNFIAIKEAEKQKQIAKIRKKTSRELRKLNAHRRGVISKYHEVNIVDEHADKKSEIYGPLMRHGEHPKRWHQIIDERMKKYRAQFIGETIFFFIKTPGVLLLQLSFEKYIFPGVEQFSTLPRWLDQATRINKRNLPPKTPGKTRLCIKETRWTTPVLKQLHEELKNFRKETKKGPVTLREKLELPPSEVPTPEVEGVAEEEEELYEAIVLLQSIIRGRSTQMMIYEGRDTCKELIQELKLSVGLLRKEKEQRRKEKLRVKVQQREEEMQMDVVQWLESTLGSLQGSIVGTLLDFLNKELRRLLEERKAHAMCLINERERYVREAAEAGRRQKELRRRREHDEMFKQVVKVTQDSVDMYLQDIVSEGMDFASNEEAKQYITTLAKKIDKETSETYEASKNISITEHDELVADLVHHFMLPEVQKILVRNKMRAQQKQKLRTVHDTIYSEFENLPKVEYSKTSSPSSESATTSSCMETDLASPSKDHEGSFMSYQDPYELYLAKLAEEQHEADFNYDDINDVFSFSVDDNNFDFRHDDLDTIPEVDTESNSMKPPANTESSSENL
ncbi:hypothetical protein NQ315_006399 [Exocentrus adspersus]|uniref:Cilia- and flagella-associated protein 91 n=1 Tax=Exocentrus adspersus TaxID=1586481 RepID=A0AAV8W014_9CUCU|nr:hypothetical protein NQ315_006399 [Exocentrus adspersus]